LNYFKLKEWEARHYAMFPITKIGMFSDKQNVYYEFLSEQNRENTSAYFQSLLLLLRHGN
jgi:hypothetical protein